MAPYETNKDDAPKGKAKRRKRGGVRNWERKKVDGRKGPPPTPQLKVTIRNIHNADQNGTVRNVGDRILRKLVQLASDKLNSPDRIALQWDEAGFCALAEADEAARKVREEWKTKQGSEGKITDTKETNKEGDVADTIESTHSNNDSSELQSAVVVRMEQLTIANPPQDESTIHVRALYVVPPKKTKRRGEKTGYAYLILTAPPIAAREPQTDQDAASTRSGKSASDHVQAPVDYSQDVARRRLMIQRTLDSLIKTADEDAKTKQEFSECVVLESLSGKTWKPRTDTIRRDRMEGTIEETADYKAFFDKSEQEKEERKARPKPAPGGGASFLMTSATSSNNHGGQPVAAIVLHLRKKQEEEKKRKQGKSKTKDGNGNKGLSIKSDSSAGAKGVRGKKRKKKTASSGTSKPSSTVKVKNG
jgi:hypothetical protein